MIELLVIGATVTLAAWASGAQTYRKSLAVRALDAYARSRALVFAPAAGPRASPQVIGSKDGVRYVVDLYRLAGDVRTRVSAEAVHGRGPVLSLLHRGAFELREGPPASRHEHLGPPSSPDEHMGPRQAPPLRLGDDALDRAYVLKQGTADDADLLRALGPSLLVLDARRKGVWLAADGARVTVSWRGMESDPLVLDAAREIAVNVAGWHRSDVPYR